MSIYLNDHLQLTSTTGFIEHTRREWTTVVRVVHALMNKQFDRI